MRVEVVRSGRRRRTIQAQESRGVLRVLIPASFTKAEEDHWVEVMVARIRRKTTATGIDLIERSEQLARRYRLPTPSSIRWSNTQMSRWGSCRQSDGTIRISTRLAAFPPWVLDYVIVHELAHLVEGAHNRRFRELVAHYPKAERAEGFLIAMGLHGDRAPASTPEPEGAQPALF